MSHEFPMKPATVPPAGAAVILVLALLLGASSAGPTRPDPPEPEVQPAWSRSPDAPVVGPTATNLQAAFANEMNARERYAEWARIADAEGRDEAARLFRACALAESVHARRHVQAIAYTGQPARAVLEKVWSGSTERNLESAIAIETYECETWYPAMLARARADRQPMAVRSMTYALATERGHVILLKAALARLGSPPLVVRYHVCPGCGRTTDRTPHAKCPCCFTPSARFLQPA
jgi:rubrerythrin